MRGEIIVIAAIIVAAVTVAGSLVATRNQLSTDRSEIDARWSQLDQEIKHRAQTTADIMAAMGASQANTEEVTKDRLALFRASDRAAEITANDQLNAAVNRLLAAGENDLKAKPTQELSDAEREWKREEDQIATARGSYNQAVQRYNRAIRLFPKSISANLFGFKPYRENAPAQ